MIGYGINYDEKDYEKVDFSKYSNEDYKKFDYDPADFSFYFEDNRLGGLAQNSDIYDFEDPNTAEAKAYSYNEPGDDADFYWMDEQKAVKLLEYNYLETIGDNTSFDKQDDGTYDLYVDWIAENDYFGTLKFDKMRDKWVIFYKGYDDDEYKKEFYKKVDSLYSDLDKSKKKIEYICFELLCKVKGDSY